MNKLIEELKRRNVLRAATFYAAGAWLLVQVATQVFPFFDIPNWAVRLVVIAVLVGFPFALVISWFYELTPAGFVREVEPGSVAPGSIWHHRAFRTALASAAAVALTLAIAAGLVSRRAEPVQAGKASIAVLPFRNLSANADTAYFAEGIQDEILTRLTRIGALRVIARSSSARYTSAPEDLSKVVRELGVENVLEGSVQRHDDEVRINVQLVQALTNTNLWSETYDRKLTDMFGVESEVAKAVAVWLKATLTGAEKRELDSAPTVNAEAHDQYLRGMALIRRSFEPANLLGAARSLRRAVELDPQFAEAWAALAQTDASIAYQIDATPGQCDKAGEEAATALRLEPDLAKAHQAQGYYLLHCKSDLDGAQAAFEQARRELPGSPQLMEAMGIVERRRGRLAKAADYMEQAEVLDPANTELLGNHALTLVELRRFDQAHALADKSLNLAPDDPAMLTLQVFTHQAEGQLGQAQKLLEPLALHPQDPAVFDYQVLQLIYQRRYADAAALLKQALAQDLSPLGIGAGDYYYLLGVALRAGGEAGGARQAFADGHAFMLRFSGSGHSADIRLYRDALLCLCSAGGGNAAASSKECPVVEGEGASDDVFAPSAREALARADALRGRTEAVMTALPGLLQASYYSYLYNAPLTSALLRQDPVWDALRNDARFQALANAAPKEP